MDNVKDLECPAVAASQHPPGQPLAYPYLHVHVDTVRIVKGGWSATPSHQPVEKGCGFSLIHVSHPRYRGSSRQHLPNLLDRSPTLEPHCNPLSTNSLIAEDINDR